MNETTNIDIMKNSHVGNYLFSFEKGINYKGVEYYRMTINNKRFKYPKSTLLGSNYDRAIKYYEDTIKNYQESAEIKKEYKMKDQKALEELKQKIQPGTILNTSWGWEQTNVEFFEVVEVKGSFVFLRQIAQEREETGFMCGYCKPIKGAYLKPRFEGDEMGSVLKRKITCSGVKIHSSAHAHLWDGDKEYWSSYA